MWLPKKKKKCKSGRMCVLRVNVGSLSKGFDKQVHHSIYVHWFFPYEFQWPVYMTQRASSLLVQHEKAAWVHNLRVAAAASASVRGDSCPTTWAWKMCLKDNYPSVCGRQTVSSIPAQIIGAAAVWPTLMPTNARARTTDTRTHTESIQSIPNWFTRSFQAFHSREKRGISSSVRSLRLLH